MYLSWLRSIGQLLQGQLAESTGSSRSPWGGEGATLGCQEVSWSSPRDEPSLWALSMATEHLQTNWLLCVRHLADHIISLSPGSLFYRREY